MKLSPAKQAIAEKARQSPDFWSWWIHYRHPTGETGCMGGGIIVSGKTDEAKAAEARDKDAAYYIGMGCEILPASTLDLMCGACGGSGKVDMPRKKRQSIWTCCEKFRCPYCEGGKVVAK